MNEANEKISAHLEIGGSVMPTLLAPTIKSHRPGSMPGPSRFGSAPVSRLRGPLNTCPSIPTQRKQSMPNRLIRQGVSGSVPLFL